MSYFIANVLISLIFAAFVWVHGGPRLPGVLAFPWITLLLRSTAACSDEAVKIIRASSHPALCLPGSCFGHIRTPSFAAALSPQIDCFGKLAGTLHPLTINPRHFQLLSAAQELCEWLYTDDRAVGCFCCKRLRAHGFENSIFIYRAQPRAPNG